MNLPQSPLLQQLQPSDKRPRPSNWRDALRIWNLENVGLLHPLWGRWKGTSFPFLHRNVCLWGRNLIGPDNWNKAAIHSSRGTGSTCGEGFDLLNGFLWATFNVSSSYSRLLRAETAQYKSYDPIIIYKVASELFFFFCYQNMNILGSSWKHRLNPDDADSLRNIKMLSLSDQIRPPSQHFPKQTPTLELILFKMTNTCLWWNTNHPLLNLYPASCVCSFEHVL